MGIELEVSAADHLVECAAAGVLAVLVFAEFTALPHLPGEGVVVGELFELPCAESVKSAIAGVAEVEVIGGEPGAGESGGHAL